MGKSNRTSGDVSAGSTLRAGKQNTSKTGTSGSSVGGGGSCGNNGGGGSGVGGGRIVGGGSTDQTSLPVASTSANDSKSGCVIS